MVGGGGAQRDDGIPSSSCTFSTHLLIIHRSSWPSTLAIVPIIACQTYYTPPSTNIYQKMTIQVVVPNVGDKYPRRGDRMQEEPSAKNAQGLFPPDACIFVGK
jgi:hypothetical protein